MRKICMDKGLGREKPIIFAGYSEQMKYFLDRNPGMSSRIAFHVEFEDYSVPELCDITGLLLSRLEISAATTEPLNRRGQGIWDYLEAHPEIDEYIILDDNRFDFEEFPRLWERLLLTDGIENAVFASKTPAVEAIIFMDYIKELS